MLLISVGAHIFQHLLQQTETILCFCFVLLILFFVCLFVFQQLHISPVLEKLDHTEIQIIQLWRESCYGYLMMVSEGKRLLWLHCPGVCPSSTLLSVSVTFDRRKRDVSKGCISAAHPHKGYSSGSHMFCQLAGTWTSFTRQWQHIAPASTQPDLAERYHLLLLAQQKGQTKARDRGGTEVGNIQS